MDFHCTINSYVILFAYDLELSQKLVKYHAYDDDITRFATWSSSVLQWNI